MCIKVAKNENWERDVEPQPRSRQKTVPERFMKWYAEQLLKPKMKFLVIVLFLADALPIVSLLCLFVLDHWLALVEHLWW